MVALVEFVPLNNQSGPKALHPFLDKAAELLERRIHLLILEALPAKPCYPGGVNTIGP